MGLSKPPVEIRNATLCDARWVAAHLREQDKREIEAVVQCTSDDLARLSLEASEPHAFIAYYREEPAACFGVSRSLPAHGAAWLWGTDRLVRCVPAITRFWRDVLHPGLRSAGYRRLEVRSIVDHDIAHQWIAKLGGEREGIAKGYGRNGEDFVTYGMVLGVDNSRVPSGDAYCNVSD